MKVTCNTVDEFLVCLDSVKGILEDTIRISSSRNDTGDGAKFEIVIQVSTVVFIDDESQYLLDVGVFCGMDYEDATQEKKGSNILKEFCSKIAGYTESRGWKVLPGIIEI